MRSSTIPKKRIKVMGPFRESGCLCVGCGHEIATQFAYTGSVLGGLRFAERKSTISTPIEILRESPNEFVMTGGDQLEVAKRFGFYSRKKGYICLECAANYRGITDSKGQYHPFVKTDSRVINKTLISARETIKSDQPFDGPAKKVFSNRLDNHWLNVGRRK